MTLPYSPLVFDAIAFAHTSEAGDDTSIAFQVIDNGNSLTLNFDREVALAPDEVIQGIVASILQVSQMDLDLAFYGLGGGPGNPGLSGTLRDIRDELESVLPDSGPYLEPYAFAEAERTKPRLIYYGNSPDPEFIGYRYVSDDDATVRSNVESYKSLQSPETWELGTTRTTTFFHAP